MLCLYDLVWNPACCEQARQPGTKWQEGGHREKHAHLETNLVTERTARMVAEQRVQSLTAQLQTLANVYQKPDNPGAISVDRDDRHEGVDKGWQAGHVCERCVTSDTNLMDAMTNSGASETRVMNVGMRVGPEQDCCATLHFLHKMSNTGKALDVAGNAGEGEGLETACPGVRSASEIVGSWSDAEAAGCRVYQRHRVCRSDHENATT